MNRDILTTEHSNIKMDSIPENNSAGVKNQQNQKWVFMLLRSAMIVVIMGVFYILYDIVSKGISVISWEFLSQSPSAGMTEGGILPALLGTVFVTGITAVTSYPLGIGTAIYLNEYSSQTLFTRIVRLSIRNLAGVPSIVYGLFGVALFVQALSLRASILSAGLTLGLLTLPVTITAAEEALKAVPDSYREGALALGATKWQAIRTSVIPVAVPGMMTGLILGLSRAAGETAPILFTGAAFFLPRLPDSIFSRFMALPYHLFIMATQHHSPAQVRPIAYGTALVLMIIVLGMNVAAMYVRSSYRKRQYR